MPLLQKEVIAPDEYHTPDGVVRATPARIRHWYEQGRKMLAKRLQVPAPWEHQEGAKPQTAAQQLADQAKYNAGFVRKYFLDRDGRLWCVLDIPDPKTAAHIERDVKYVSPEIDPEFTDGDGQTWHDVITHVAITPRPVAHRQSPFGTKPRLSHGRRCIHLSLCQRRGVPMSEYDDDRDDDDTDAPADGDQLLDEIKGLLSQKMGLDLPSHTTDDTLKRDLCVALHAHPGHELEGDGGDSEQMGEDEEDEEQAGRDFEQGDRRGAREELPTAMMSRRRAGRQLSHAGRRTSAARGAQAAQEQLRNSGFKIAK